MSNAAIAHVPKIAETVERRSILKTNEQVPAKKPYEKPTLRIYGNVRVMTQSVSTKAGKYDTKHQVRKTN